LIATPIMTFFLVLALAYALDPRCGSPGESGGCEMGSVSIALASAIPGAALLFMIVLIRGQRARRKAGEPPQPPIAP
jgi:hypothetical protein